MEVYLDDIIVSKSGDSNGGSNCNLYGQNAAVLVKDGAIATIDNAQVVSTARGASGVFSYGGSSAGKGDGTRVDISNSTITTSGDNSGGVMTTGGGETHVDNLTISTSGESSAPIRSDQGGGKVFVKGGTYVSTGVDSPAVYSMADISVEDATLISHASPGLIIRGKHSINLQDCTLTADNDILPDRFEQKTGIMIFDPDNGRGLAELSIKGGTINNIKGHVIHVTNTKAKIVLNDVAINNSDDANTLISVTNDGWGGSENNASLELKSMTVSGDVLVNNEPTTYGHEGSVLDLILSGNTIYTGGINHGILAGQRGTVNLTVRQGSKFILTHTSYVTSLVNNGKIICGDYELYVNGEKYDDGGSLHPTESSVTFNGTSYSVKDRYGKINVEQDAYTKAITATIKKAGQFTFTGNALNTSIRIAKGLKDVIIILSGLTIDNTRCATATGKDSSVIIFEPEAGGEIVLKGTNKLIGPNTYHTLPRAILRGNESNLVFSGNGTLTITDTMPSTTKFKEDYPDCISNYKGNTTFNGGVYNLRSNGSAIKNVGGTLNFNNSTFNIEHTGQDAINANDGIFNMTSGKLDVSESDGAGITASCIESSSKGSINISGGEVRLYKIADSGIRGENILITDGTVDITNIYQNSADIIYVPGNDVVNKITIYPVNDSLDKIRINYNAGTHHGIEAGRRAMSYSYDVVPATDPKHEAGVVYTQAASGSLSITGGVVNIDTTITGLLSNLKVSPGDSYPCSNGLYAVGAPGHGIMSYGTVAVSGGNLNIRSGGDGINCDGTVVINRSADVTIPLAFAGIRASDIILGASNKEASQLKIYPMDTSLVTETKSYTYTYDNSNDEHNHYTIDVIKSESTNNVYIYGTTLDTQVDSNRVVSVTLRSGNTKKDYTYKAKGTAIDTKGYVYVDSGDAKIFGPDSPDFVPVKHKKGFLVNESTLMLITGVDDNDASMPKYGSAVYVQLEEGKTFKAGDIFKVDTTEDNPIYRGTLLNSGSFLIFIHPAFVSRKLYRVTIGDNSYLLMSKNTLNGGGDF